MKRPSSLQVNVISPLSKGGKAVTPDATNGNPHSQLPKFFLVAIRFITPHFKACPFFFVKASTAICGWEAHHIFVPAARRCPTICITSAVLLSLSCDRTGTSRPRSPLLGAVPQALFTQSPHSRFCSFVLLPLLYLEVGLCELVEHS